MSEYGKRRTQKARGIEQSKTVAYLLRAREIHGTEIIGIEDAIIETPPDIKGKFVRPCPTTPRHGFVDSRIVKSADEFSKLAWETYSMDENAEIVIMPYISADSNMILTPSGITFGHGHDGATSGKQALTLPVASNLSKRLGANLLKLSGVGENEDPYIELVTTWGPGYSSSKANIDNFVTQLRAGPRINGLSDDYVPQDMEISDIVEIEDGHDLVAWETEARELAEQEGVVVYHPGGALSSHFGVHCVINKLPYITSKQPVVGGKLKRTDQESWVEQDYVEVAKWIRRYDSIGAPVDPKEVALMGIGALHALSSFLLNRNRLTPRVLGMALAWMPRVFAALTLGECRHTSCIYKWDILEGVQPFPKGHMAHVDSYWGLSRDQVYKSAMDSNLREVGEILAWTHVVHDLGQWSGGYGGEAWRKCAEASINFHEDITRFLRNPGEERALQLFNTFNTTMNQAHNGGWWLNKIMTKEHADLVSDTPCIGLAQGWLNTALRYDVPLGGKKGDLKGVWSQVWGFKVRAERAFQEAGAKAVSSADVAAGKVTTTGEKIVPVIAPLAGPGKRSKLSEECIEIYGFRFRYLGPESIRLQYHPVGKTGKDFNKEQDRTAQQLDKVLWLVELAANKAGKEAPSLVSGSSVPYRTGKVYRSMVGGIYMYYIFVESETDVVGNYDTETGKPHPLAGNWDAERKGYVLPFNGAELGTLLGVSPTDIHYSYHWVTTGEAQAKGKELAAAEAASKAKQSKHGVLQMKVKAEDLGKYTTPEIKSLAQKIASGQLSMPAAPATDNVNNDYKFLQNEVALAKGNGELLPASNKAGVKEGITAMQIMEKYSESDNLSPAAYQFALGGMKKGLHKYQPELVEEAYARWLKGKHSGVSLIATFKVVQDEWVLKQAQQAALGPNFAEGKATTEASAQSKEDDDEDPIKPLPF